jgi:hypothetical protein
MITITSLLNTKSVTYRNYDKKEVVHSLCPFECKIKHKIFLFFTGVNNEDTNKFGMAGLQNSVSPLINNSCSHGDIS